jgi:hypothetical protein
MPGCDSALHVLVAGADEGGNAAFISESSPFGY